MKTTIYDSKNIPLQTGEGRSCSRGTRRTNSDEGANRNAFTLAEVLITLGIIGVVAALTLPTIITKYQKQETATKLKKVYTILQQAVRAAEVDNEALKYWEFRDGNNFFDTYMKSHLRVLTDYKNTRFPTEYAPQCLNLNKTNCLGYGELRDANTRKVILSDGTLLSFQVCPLQGGQKIGVIIVTDINGFKKPNRYGRDLFLLTIQPEFGVVPYGAGYITNSVYWNDPNSLDRNKLLANDHVDMCNKNKGGGFCAAVIYMDNWEIKDDYPW